MELVRAHNRPFRSDWDYGAEDPKQDARGYRAKTLLQEKEEQEFERQDRHRPFSFREMKSDLMLGNGARFYNDHTHPEYSTPECAALRDLVAYDRAGERILLACSERRNRMLGVPEAVQIYKNNTDFHGHSYGCHDNYLLPRSVPFNDLVIYLLPFLVTRQIFAGAGKIGVENGSNYRTGRYQISQRADFIRVEVSIDTMHDRPIINTRDEPHADSSLYRRLHLILGDANMSEFATALKVGTTWMVLRLIEEGLAPKEAVIDRPVETLRAVSLDPTVRQPIRLADGREITPVDHQRLYLAAAKHAYSNEDEESRWILNTWESVLNDLADDSARLADRLDWVAKKWLLETFMEAEGTDWSDPRLTSLDLEYHNINPSRGLFLGLEAEGKMHRLVDDELITRAMTEPPPDTRAGVRGLAVQRFLDQIDRIQWEKVSFRGKEKRSLYMDRLFDREEIVRLMDKIKRSRNVEEIFRES
ncbi:MAG TPA: proteasome accessory factor PafA2 family protein, partial [Nitrospiria bacterium]|nr:proteasome accessory factor PafA2 family protein [Nitrospiria bacterium]